VALWFARMKTRNIVRDLAFLRRFIGRWSGWQNYRRKEEGGGRVFENYFPVSDVHGRPNIQWLFFCAYF
jgi:hypothetical protein